MFNNFKHKTPVQIRFKDIDKLGHVNNANHLTYFELARMKYFEDVIGDQIDWKKQGVILARIEINYKLPILLEDKISVFTKSTRFGTKSFDLDHYIVKETTKGEYTELANGLSIVVCFDYEKSSAITIPQNWLDKVKQYE